MDCEAEQQQGVDENDSRRTTKRTRSASDGDDDLDQTKRVRLADLPNSASDTVPFYIDLLPSRLPEGVSFAANLYDYISTSSIDALAPVPVLGEPLDTSSDSTKRDSRTCFNCLGDHLLSACPFRRDAGAISANRAAFRQQQGSATDRGKLGVDGDGENESRRRMLSFVDRYRPGVISEDLREALGYGRSDPTSNTALSPEYPFFQQIREWGYPPGWVSYGERIRDIFDVIRDRIGREEAWDDIDLLVVYGGEQETEDSKDIERSSRAQDGLDISSSNFEDPQSSSSVPLPPSSAPPAPPAAPPPPQRLVQYQTTLFDSFKISLHRPDAALPQSHPISFHQHMRLYQERTSASDAEMTAKQGATGGERNEEDSDMELQSSSSDSEA